MDDAVVGEGGSVMKTADKLIKVRTFRYNPVKLPCLNWRIRILTCIPNVEDDPQDKELAKAKPTRGRRHGRKPVKK